MFISPWFVLLLSILVYCQLIELIWAFFVYKFPIFHPASQPPPPSYLISNSGVPDTFAELINAIESAHHTPSNSSPLLPTPKTPITPNLRPSRGSVCGIPQLLFIIIIIESYLEMDTFLNQLGQLIGLFFKKWRRLVVQFVYRMLSLLSTELYWVTIFFRILRLPFEHLVESLSMLQRWAFFFCDLR